MYIWFLYYIIRKCEISIPKKKEDAVRDIHSVIKTVNSVLGETESSENFQDESQKLKHS